MSARPSNRKKRPESAPATHAAPAYAEAGVDLGRDEEFVSTIAEISRSTLRPEILSSIGGFAGLFKAPERYRNPVFVAGADGVGTKLKFASLLGRYDTIGIDCVAMVANDLVVHGAEPLVFLDYLAMEGLDEPIATQILRGVAEGCRRAGCTLVGGETANMPGFYARGDVELVGFGVGVVERDRVIDGSSIGQDDVLIGVASGGLHSNGFSLVRRIVEEGQRQGALELRSAPDSLNTTLEAALLAPTRIYVKSVLNLLRDFDVHGIVHITGGGFAGNIPRVLPKGVRARIDPAAWPRPPIFGLLARHGGIDEGEMLRVFNCGIGLVLVLHRKQADEVRQRLAALGERAYLIGAVEPKGPGDAPLLFAPLGDAGR